jgi:hypothetical protein
MVRKATAETISYLTFDEPVEDRAAIIAAVKDAEAKELYEYGMLTQRFFMIIQNGMINSSINRQSFVATRENIAAILGKMDRVMPKVIYEIAKFNEQGMKKEG